MENYPANSPRIRGGSFNFIWVIAVVCLFSRLLLADDFVEVKGVEKRISCSDLVRRNLIASGLISTYGPIADGKNKLKISEWSQRDITVQVLETERGSAILETIRNIDSDFMFLTKIVNRKAFEHLVERLPGYSGMLQYKKGDGIVQHLGFIYKQNLDLKVKPSIFIDFNRSLGVTPRPDSASLKGYRNASLVDLYKPDGTTPFLSIVHVHLNHALDRTSREKQIFLFQNKLIEYEQENPTLPKMILGNFNGKMDRGLGELSRLKDVGFSNVFDGLVLGEKTHVFQRAAADYVETFANTFLLNGAAKDLFGQTPFPVVEEFSFGNMNLNSNQKRVMKSLAVTDQRSYKNLPSSNRPVSLLGNVD